MSKVWHVDYFNTTFFYLPTDFLFKFLVIGSAGTGKSCILHQFIENKCEYQLTNFSLEIKFSTNFQGIYVKDWILQHIVICRSIAKFCWFRLNLSLGLKSDVTFPQVLQSQCHVDCSCKDLKCLSYLEHTCCFVAKVQYMFLSYGCQKDVELPSWLNRCQTGSSYSYFGNFFIKKDGKVSWESIIVILMPKWKITFHLHYSSWLLI